MFSFQTKKKKVGLDNLFITLHFSCQVILNIKKKKKKSHMLHQTVITAESTTEGGRALGPQT